MAAVKGRTVRIGGKKLFTFHIPTMLIYLFLIALVLFTAMPLIYVVSTAFKPLDEMYLFPPTFFARKPTFHNFTSLFATLDSNTVPFLRYVFNSLYIAVATVIGTVLVSCMGAYSLVKHHPKGSNLLFSLVMMALMFSPYVTQIPNYLIVKSMNLLDSHWALILPKLAVPYNFFLIKQFVEQLPNPLLEAARIDGAGEGRIFWHIVMPYLKPAWATLVVFSFVANWNDYFSPLVFITRDALKTLPLALQNISGGAGAAGLATAGATAAATFLMTLPTVLIYTLMQKRVIATMAHSGIK